MKERRRSERKPLQATVQMIGMKPGTASSAAYPAQIVDVGDHGALIECRTKFEPGTELIVQLHEGMKSSLAVVIRAVSAGSVWRMGVELKEASGKDFWGES